MPKKYDSCVKKVKRQGKSTSSAHAICQTSVMGKSKKKRTKKKQMRKK